MVNRNLLRQFDLPEEDYQQQLAEAMGRDSYEPTNDFITFGAGEETFDVNNIVKGRVLHIAGDEVVVDVGYKSEGVIPLEEWKDEGSDKVTPPKPGDEIQVLLEAVEDESGVIVLSYRKAKRQKEWEDVIAKHKEGDVVAGAVTRKIKGGLLVNIGVNNPHEVVHIDQQLEVYIISVDKEKEKIALGLKQKSPSPWAEVERKYPIGTRHTGEVVNVMSYGAFVKLEPGIEGLVHISEMGWTKRINHPNELVSIGDQVEEQVLNINKEKQEI